MCVTSFFIFVCTSKASAALFGLSIICGTVTIVFVKSVTLLQLNDLTTVCSVLEMRQNSAKKNNAHAPSSWNPCLKTWIEMQNMPIWLRERSY